MNETFLFNNKFPVTVKKFEAGKSTSENITFILLPAIGVPIKKYQNFIAELNSYGFNVVTADYPCCGENQPHIEKGKDYGYADLVKDFVPHLISSADTKNIILLGHSLGGHLATLYAIDKTIPVIGIATGNIHYKNWDGLGKLTILKAVGLFKILTNLYGYLPGYKIGFGVKEAKTLIKDWCHTALTGNYSYYLNNDSLSEAKAYFINIKGDDFAPLQSTKKLAEMFNKYKLESIDLGENFKGNKHSSWLKDPKQIVKGIKTNIGELC